MKSDIKDTDLPNYSANMDNQRISLGLKHTDTLIILL